MADDPKVTSILPKLNRRRAAMADAELLGSQQAAFSRLAALAAEQTKKIMADPLPYLTQAAQTIAVLRRGIQEATLILQGSDELLTHMSSCPQTKMDRNRRCGEHLARLLRESET